MPLVSDCCGAFLSTEDNDAEDMGICPECLEHCSFVKDKEGDDLDELEPERGDFDNYQGHDI